MKKFLTAVGMIAIIASLVPSFVFADNSGSTLQITTTAMPDATAGQDYSFQFQASGGTGSYTWETYSVTHPCCYVGINPTTGVFSNSGTGLKPLDGIYPTGIQVKDSSGATARKLFYWAVRPFSLKVTVPNGGENWAIGSYQTVRWTDSAPSSRWYNVYLQSPSGGFIGFIAKELKFPTDTSVLWLVKNVTDTNGATVVVQPGSDYRVQVSRADGSIIDDQSDASFTISGSQQDTGTLKVLSPNGGEQWQRGTSHPITWSAPSSIPAVSIYAVSGVSNCTPYACIQSYRPTVRYPIASSVPNTGSYSWSVGSGSGQDLPLGSYIIEIDAAGNTATDSSDASFNIADSQTSNTYIVLSADKTIGVPPLTVNFSATLYNLPNCGENWNFGEGGQGGSCAVNPLSGSYQQAVASRTVTISHTYAASGTYPVTVTSNGATSNTVTVYVSSKSSGVIHIGTDSSLTGSLGQNFVAQFTAQGGTPPYSDWTVTSGSLPSGLQIQALNPGCASLAGRGIALDCGLINNLYTLSGTPTQAGQYTFELATTDRSGNRGSSQFTVSISDGSVMPPPAIQCGPLVVKVDDDPTVYFITAKCLKMPKVSARALLSYGTKWSEIQIVTQEQLDAYDDVNYIRLCPSTRIYKIDGGRKYYLSPAAIKRLGISVSDAVCVNKTEFYEYKTGATIR